MSAPKDSQNFMDPKTLIAIVFVGMSWMGWQFYMQKKYPNMYVDKQPTSQEITNEKANSRKEISAEVDAPQSQNVLKNEGHKNDEFFSDSREEIELVFEDEKWSLVFSSKGMGLKKISLKDYSDRNGQPMTIGGSNGSSQLPYATSVIGRTQPLNFSMKKISEKELLGQATFGQARIEKRILINSEKHTLETKLLVSGVSNEETFSGIKTYLSDHILHTESGLPFLPQFEKQEVFVLHDGEEDRIILHDKDVVENYEKAKIVSLGSQYFAQALIDKSDVMPKVKAVVDTKASSIVTSIEHEILTRSKDFSLNYLGFAGPKNLKLLNSVDPDLSSIINYGWFSGLAKLILKVMKFFFGFVGNWGVAIILMTILVRFVVLPFNLMSFKSMKKMQEIQPRIKALREKYKDEPQKLNTEMMTLFKENRVNPMGGCLPMLLQFPVFIALYQMLGQSIELYQAPFVFWIHDLSLKDPYYVLPVLMGITMFLQQKITPSTMDPTQQKVFMFMPIIFSLLMVTLPSGLTLYIFISALFAVIQQALLMRPKLQPAS